MTKKTVLITGASRGLGAAAAVVAADLGANVVLSARSADRLAEQVDLIHEHGGGAIAVPADISRHEECLRLVDKTIEVFGRIDSLVNNAGIVSPVAPISQTDPEAWRENLATNLLGPMMMTQAALPQIRLHHGRIINVSSSAAGFVLPGMSAYCTAKAGLNHFNRILAAEEQEIAAIGFYPGVVDTALMEAILAEGESGMPPETHARFIEHKEQGRLLPPQVPGGALAILALFAPHEWSGQLVKWDDPAVQKLRLQYSAGH